MGVSIVRKTMNAPEIKRRLYQRASAYGGVPALPVHVDYQHRNTRMRVLRSGESFTQVWGEDLVTTARGMDLNGPELLEVFASIRTPDEVLPFLEFAGPFRSRGLNSQTVCWSEFNLWQQFVYALRRQELLLPLVSNVFSDFSHLEAITDPQPEMPHFVGSKRVRRMQFRPKTALEYIGTVVYIDYLRGVDLHICDLPTCKKLFERNSDRAQFYCCTAHGRQHSKNLSRQQKREEAAHAKASRIR